VFYVPTHLKGMNRRLVYEALANVGRISRAELARSTGISAPTIGKIVSFFVESGIASEMGEGTSEMGRKPQMLRFNNESFFTIGVEFEGDGLKVGVIDLLGNLKAFQQMPAKSSFDAMMQGELAASIKATLREARLPMSRIWGVGIGIPGVVDVGHQTISTAPLIGVAEKRSYKEALEQLGRQLKVPVFVENDANAAAIGEYRLRREQGEADLIYLSVGTGVGGGIILDGRLRKGAHFSAGEVGYMIFDKQASSHTSEAGWLESRINHRALLKAKRGTDFLEGAASDLALAIANLASVLDVDLFVVGGIGLADYGTDFLERISRHVGKLSDLAIRIEAPLAKEPGVIGAGAFVVDNILDDKMTA
jgi:predicted NBD/HSP70 family sugar kinase